MAAFDLSLSPPQLELILKPGATIIHTYEITNNTYQNLSLSISIDPWLPQGPEGFVSYDHVPANPYLSFSLSNSDLKLNQTFILPPQTHRQLILKIKSATDTPLGDSYYTLFVNQDSSSLTGDLTHSAAAAKVGSHLLISSANSDQIPQKALIKNLTVAPKLKDILFTPLQISAEIQNTTDFYFPISGTLAITKNNLLIKQFNLTPDNILSHNSRLISCDNSPCLLKPPFWPGKYTATITTPFSPSHSTSFYIFPFSLITLLIPLTISLTLLFRRSRHH
jgi:hypothetical protein